MMEQLMDGQLVEMKAGKWGKGSVDLRVELMDLKKADPSVDLMVRQSVDD